MNERIELYLVGVLRGLLPGFDIVPMQGGDDESDSDEVEPPFLLCKVLDCPQVMDHPPTYQVTAKLGWFSQTDDTTVPQHKEKFDQVKAAANRLPAGYYESTDITINGVTINGTDEVRDDPQNVRGSVVVLAIGVTEGHVS